MDVGVRLAFANHLPQQVEVAVEAHVAALLICRVQARGIARGGARRSSSADGQQVAQLAVVHAHVRVDEFGRHGLARHGGPEEVEHQVGVVDGLLHALGEAVAIVPLAHHVEGCLFVQGEHASLPVGLQQAPHFRFSEAEQSIELRRKADVGADVEAAGHVVQRDGRDAGDEQPFQAAAAASRAALQGSEEVAVEAAAVGQFVVGLGAVVGQYGVGEVVVFVDEHIEPHAASTRFTEQRVELAGCGWMVQDADDDVCWEEVWMAIQGFLDLLAAVALELPLQRLRRVLYHREIEAQRYEAVSVCGGFAADVRATEHLLELAGPLAVVVVLQQREPAGLAEAPGADEEDEAFVLQRAEEVRLVDVQAVFQAHGAEVRPAVGDAGIAGGGHGDLQRERPHALAPRFRQQQPQRCQHSAWAFAVHGHAEPVGGFFALHGLDAFRHGAHVLAVAHRGEAAEQQAEGEGQIFAEGALGRCVLRSPGAAHENPGLRQLAQHPVFNEFQIASAQAGNSRRHGDLRRGWAWQLPHFVLGLAGAP